jgi:hypothetical protein
VTPAKLNVKRSACTLLVAVSSSLSVNSFTACFKKTVLLAERFFFVFTTEIAVLEEVVLVFGRAKF